MAVLRSDIERALDDLVSNEAGMKFQGLAVVLAKQRWPDLIGSERKSDLGADAIAKGPFAAAGTGKVLACSTTATLKKLRTDAEKIKKHFKGITKLVFATPMTISNERGEAWAAEIRRDFGYELAIMEREDIVTSLMDPTNASLLQSQLGLAVEMNKSLTALVEKVRAAAAKVTADWAKRTDGKPLIKLRALRLDPVGRDTSDVLDLAYIQTLLIRSERVLIEAPAGCGKTTTLIQLARTDIGVVGIAILISLPDWINSGNEILQFVAGMPQFKALGLNEDDLVRVMNVVHFSFLLNGWNEIGESEFAHADRALRGLERDYPSVGIAVATRTHHLVPPLPALRARLLPLSRRERTSYLRARLRHRADDLRLKLDTDQALDELTR